ncbi:MAG: hypothetical protein ACHQNA_04010 [Acidimicrobiales bacterium]
MPLWHPDGAAGAVRALAGEPQVKVKAHRNIGRITGRAMLDRFAGPSRRP